MKIPFEHLLCCFPNMYIVILKCTCENAIWMNIELLLYLVFWNCICAFTTWTNHNLPPYILFLNCIYKYTIKLNLELLALYCVLQLHLLIYYLNICVVASIILRSTIAFVNILLLYIPRPMASIVILKIWDWIYSYLEFHKTNPWSLIDMLEYVSGI